MSSFCGLFALLCVLVTASAQYQPIARLYSNQGCSGAFVTIPAKNYVPDLSSLEFDGRAYSVSLRGPWMFYDLQNYNTAADSLMEYIFESAERCVDFWYIGGYATSVKYAGHSSDYRRDSITFYEFTFFQSFQEIAQTDLPNLALDGRIASLIITGSSDWTIYDRFNYNGNAICLQILESPFYEPAFVNNTILLDPPVPHGSIASVRRGCFTDKVITLQRGAKDASIHEISVAPNVSFQF